MYDEDGGGGSPLDDDVEPRRRSSRLGRGTTLLVAAAALAVAVGSILFYSDRNADRYELRCSRGHAEGRRGLYFLWGTGQIDDDAHAPLDLPQGVSCAGARFETLHELDVALGELLLESAEQRLTQGGPEALAQARQNVERARRLHGLPEEQLRRSEALLADMAYHEGREILRQVERDLWQARRKLERARALGAGERIGDLDQWLEFVETETERFRPALGGGQAEEEDSGADAPPDGGPPPQEPAPTEEFFL